MSISIRSCLFSLLLLACGVADAFATPGDWNIVLNGKAFHLKASEDWNEQNWGLGVEREYNSQARWVPVVLGNAFRDSSNDMSYMAGGGIKRRFHIGALAQPVHVDLGVFGFLMTRQDHNGSRPFPGVLPAISVGMQRVALNVTYLPQAAVNRINRRDPSLEGVLFLQLKVDFSLLRPRNVGWR